jgi:hypothetical protein
MPWTYIDLPDLLEVRAAFERYEQATGRAGIARSRSVVAIKGESARKSAVRLAAENPTLGERLQPQISDEIVR